MPDRSPVAPTIELLCKAHTSRMYELNAPLLRIGRDRSSDICLDDNRVSSTHAQISRRPDGTFLVEDLKSYSATYLDGHALPPFAPAPLADGSRIRVCDFTLIFHREAVSLRDDQCDEPTILISLEDMSTVRLVSRPERASVMLRAVLDINRSLGGAAELNEMLGRATEGLFSVFPQAESGFIITREPDGKLNPRATRLREGMGKGLALSRTVLDHVIREGKGLIISDVDEPTITSGQRFNHAGLRSAVCVPVLGRSGEPIGIIQLDSGVQTATFEPDDLELLAALAVPIGVVVENYQLLKERAALSAAGEVQSALLPRVVPSAPGYVFWQHYQPALEVGGDYYDYIPVEADSGGGPWGRFAIVVGDVTGKGIPAALLMANLCAEVRHLVRTGAEPVSVASQVNRYVFDAELHGRFITFLLVLVDARLHRMTVVNAGHMCPMVRRSNGTIEEIGESEAGMPLGVECSAHFHAIEARIEPGDVVVLYTDGVNEALGRDDLLFGVDGLQRTLATTPGGPPQVGDAILRAVRLHAIGRNQSDDIALVCFGRDRD